MTTENRKITTQVVQKQEWKEPEMVELDINKTESGLKVGIEIDIIAPLLGKIS